MPKGIGYGENWYTKLKDQTHDVKAANTTNKIKKFYLKNKSIIEDTATYGGAILAAGSGIGLGGYLLSSQIKGYIKNKAIPKIVGLSYGAGVGTTGLMGGLVSNLIPGKSTFIDWSKSNRAIKKLQQSGPLPNPLSKTLLSGKKPSMTWNKKVVDSWKTWHGIK